MELRSDQQLLLGPEPDVLNAKQLQNVAGRKHNTHSRSINNIYEDNDESDDVIEHKVQMVGEISPWRWWALFLLSLLAVMQNIAYICLSTIDDSAKSYYNISSAQVNRLLEVAAIVWGIGVVFSQPLCDRYGLKWGVVVSMGFVAAGSVCRWLGKDSYNYLLIGQILNGLAGPVITNGPPDLAAQWFPISQRATATAIAWSCMSLGVSIAFFVVPKISPTKETVNLVMEYQAYLGIAAFVLSFTFPPPPKQPPTPSAAVVKIPFFKGILVLMKKPSFLLLGVVWGVAGGTAQTWANMIDIWLDHKYTDTEIGNLASVGTLLLVGGTLVFPLLVDVLGFQKHMKWGIFWALLAASAGVMQFSFCNYLDSGKSMSLWIGGIGYIAANFFYGAVSPLAIELGCEIAFPVGEGTAAAFFNAMFMIVNIGTTEVGNALQKNAVAANIGTVVMLAAAALFILPVRSPNSRLLLDK